MPKDKRRAISIISKLPVAELMPIFSWKCGPERRLSKLEAENILLRSVISELTLTRQAQAELPCERA